MALLVFKTSLPMQVGRWVRLPPSPATLLHLIMPITFEWDERKNRQNIEKHGISFRRAATIFNGRVLQWEDNRKDYGEERRIAIGLTEARILQVVYTLRNRNIRIISARKATKDERRKYLRVYP